MTTFLFISVIIVSFTVIANAEDLPCTTPNNLAGRCVPVESCFNLYAAKQLNRSLPAARENYIRNAICTLGAGKLGICCAVEKIFSLPKQCGRTSSNRIAHGNKTVPFEFPWMALLRYRDLESNEVVGDCGGSLISDRYVITAAHCLAEERRGHSLRKLEFVRLGEHTISTSPDCINYTDPTGYFEQDCAGPVEDVRIESVVIHPDYRRAFAGNDIGLIRLAETIVFKPHIKPICLPMSEDLKDALLPQYFVAGWGYTESVEKSDILMKALLPRVDREQCQKWYDPHRKRYNITISERQICAGAAGFTDACPGDSGGPLMWLSEFKAGPPRYVLFGLVSYGVKACGTLEFPGVYARVGAYLEWIVDNMKA